MFNWLKELIEIKRESQYRKVQIENERLEKLYERQREELVCESCEVLKSQVSRLTFENDRLLNEILHPTKIEEKTIDTNELKPITGGLNWRARQQLLERESRHQAQILKQKENEMADQSAKTERELRVEEIEKELGVQ